MQQKLNDVILDVTPYKDTTYTGVEISLKEDDHFHYAMVQVESAKTLNGIVRRVVINKEEIAKCGFELVIT